MDTEQPTSILPARTAEVRAENVDDSQPQPQLPTPAVQTPQPSQNYQVPDTGGTRGMLWAFVIMAVIVAILLAFIFLTEPGKQLLQRSATPPMNQTPPPSETTSEDFSGSNGSEIIDRLDTDADSSLNAGEDSDYVDIDNSTELGL